MRGEGNSLGLFEIGWVLVYWCTYPGWVKDQSTGLLIKLFKGPNWSYRASTVNKSMLLFCKDMILIYMIWRDSCSTHLCAKVWTPLLKLHWVGVLKLSSLRNVKYIKYYISVFSITVYLLNKTLLQTMKMPWSKVCASHESIPTEQKSESQAEI